MDDRPGTGGTLWDVKRLRARRAVQRAALDLIEAQGYQATTIEQICARAEVSRSSFFRYFRSKDAALRADLIAEGIDVGEHRGRPRSLAVLCDLICATYEALEPEEYAQELRRLELVHSVPELRAGFADEVLRPYLFVVDYVAGMRGAPSDSIAVHVEAGAVWGAVTGMWLPRRDEGSAEAALTLPATQAEVVSRVRAAFVEIEAMVHPPSR